MDAFFASHAAAAKAAAEESAASGAAAAAAAWISPSAADFAAASASHAAAAAAAKAAAEESAASAAAAAAAAAWPSPSAASFAAALASDAAAISATAARVVAYHEATITSFANWCACWAKSAAAAADRAAFAESWPELVWYNSEADSMPLSPSESCKAVWADNLDEPAWGHFLDDCKFEDDYGVTSEYRGISDSDLEYFGFGNNDPHCNMEILTRLSEISMEDRLNQDSERQLTDCSMGASTHCFK